MRDLSSNHKVMLYHGMGHMVSAVPTYEEGTGLIERLTQYIHRDWQNLMQQANNDNSYLLIPNVIREVDFILKINQKIASSAQTFYTPYLTMIFTDLINIYRVYTQKIQSHQGAFDKQIKQMRQARRDILKLIQINIEKTTDFGTFNQ